MRCGVHLANFGPFGEPEVIGSLAQAAEAAGWEGFFLWDHVARPEGVFPMVDPWIALAVAAVHTSRVRLGTLITPLPRRRPWNVAREIATLDHLSHGRMVLGVGVGVDEGPEFTEMGEEADPRTRGDMLDEELEIIRAAWTGEPVTHHGAHHRLDGVAFLPRPVQSRVPIWGATQRVSGRPVRRAAGLDGIFPITLDPGRADELRAEVSRHRAGSLDGYELVVTGTDDSAAWREAGATWWLYNLPWFEPLEVSRAIIDAGPPG